MKKVLSRRAWLSPLVSPDALRRTGQHRSTLVQRCKWLRLCGVPVMDAEVSWTVALFSGVTHTTHSSCTEHCGVGVSSLLKLQYGEEELTQVEQ